MKFKKLNKVQKLLLKLKNKEAYRDYKFLSRLQDVQHPLEPKPLKQDVHFKHSGNAGDVIYALPALYSLAAGRNIHFHLHLNQKGLYKNMKHPLGNVMLNEKMLAMLRPLLLQQKQFATVDAYESQVIDYDLDVFRQYPFNYKMGSISRWLFLTFGINADVSKPWLHVASDATVNDAIVIARSQRYRNPGIDYGFLNAYPRTVFIGVEEEYEEMKKSVPAIEYRPVKDFLEMASVIAGSKFFIGNQSFPFSIAEGLKVTRLLEVYHQSPNVIVEGPEGYDFCYQPHFEKLVSDLYKKTSA